MEIMNVNPTRMQMTKLKKQLQTAKRGHKMLKDKRDELMRRFIELVQENHRLREKVEHDLAECNAHFINAGAVMNQKALDAALLCFESPPPFTAQVTRLNSRMMRMIAATAMMIL